MDNQTKVDLFFEKWEPFHLQIVSIAIKYASEEVQANRLDQSFQPLCSPSLPPITNPPSPTTSTTTSTSTIPEVAHSPTPSEKDATFEFLIAKDVPPDQDHQPTLDPSVEKILDDHLDPVEVDYAELAGSEAEKEIKEEIEEEKAEEADESVNQEWLEIRKKECERWMKFMLDKLKVDPISLPENPLESDLTELSKELPISIGVEIIHDLVILSLSASHSPPDLTSSKPTSEQENILNYSALDRQLVFQVAEALKIDTRTVYGAEKLVAQELFFILQKTQEDTQAEGDGDGSLVDERAEEEEGEKSNESKLSKGSKAAIRAAAGKKKWLRYLGAGAGVIVGGVAIGLTGGLAAPILAPFLVGLSGGALGFLATSGGAILIGTLFGLAGGGLVGYRAQRRLKGIDEFTFERLSDQDGGLDGDLPHIPSLHATIVMTGFLLTPTEYKDPWISTLSKTIDRRDVYALKVETEALLAAGKDLESYVRDILLQHGATEIIRHTILASVCAALLLPASIYKAAVMALDNEYQRTRDICQKAGILLADMIEQRAHGARPLTLIGSGMGSITIFKALLELSKRGRGAGEFMIDQVILICSPLSPSPVEWKTVRRMTTRRVVNVYSKNDWVLAILARLDSLLSARRVAHVAGLRDLKLPHISSVDISDLVQGHLELSSKIPLILERIDINR
ncbi:hypothetical protein MJO28_016876 [Puccinia striiformis f. sp. tritici]|uniref:DUF726-domain-containing protein n=1 Tax=Puccinia striiformis f. sp. tritici PST-78 TaxID=1165861 RepID=A0A0L0VF15_9BASI|nr:hypothetical protein Pst134EA_002714 [Puccinia striiformis f. sp. tritici]KAI9618352.1 hypothetical protein KEM48_006805 [Puccinia striiformis f. sp. tritici PST-130]KNE97870.1 hypothetical protein PSTG_08893 [Puccinia striiformis f. sp. tritici PST-78]KAH9472088.1 hypothetical protein Pst134EA_002714 [Puccinia striiformis f. sp. tritici]KAI7935238.1 hypothetical protein MJO28_016876 [Puccinia striiformis f. sp. tritici]KAI7966369.1 hypothetical protein MJO29_002117 [Puccinia striiformis f.